MTTPANRLVLGLDVGGTSTRALVAETDGTRRGSGHAPGANLTSHSLEHALDAISAALEEALRDVDPAHVVGAVVGSAGDRNLHVPAVADAFARRWSLAGLTCEYEIRSDALVAFVAGTPAPVGTLVLSGTGAIVARAEDRDLAHIVDGHGWLLGDMGSGFWLGREAVRATLSSLDRREAPGPLGRAVLDALIGPAEPGQCPRQTAADLVLEVHSRSPVRLSELAPLVSGHAEDDHEAGRILHEAADHLVRAVSLVRPPHGDAPFVLAGSLLTHDTPLSRLLIPRLLSRWPGASVARASDATAGATWLAAVRAASLNDETAAELHRVLLPGAYTDPAVLGVDHENSPRPGEDHETEAAP